MHQVLGAHGDDGKREPDVLVCSIGRLPIGDDTECGHELLQRVGLKLARRVGAPLEKWLALHLLEDALEDSARHAEQSLKVAFVIHRVLPTNTKVVPHAGLKTSVKFTALAWPAARKRAEVPSASGDTASARAST